MYATRQEIRAACGRAIICGFDGNKVTAELKEILREVEPLGLILFARNVESPEQVAELNHELKLLDPAARLLLCVDQEGGRVARVRRPATEWPAMRVLGQVGDLKLTETVGTALARELRAMNFDVDFAPVLDVDTNPNNPVIGDRSFGRDPNDVAAHGCALIRGLQRAGIAACAKHFPGHGDTDLDSHKALPKVSHELPRLRKIEWVPFAAAAQAGVSSVMTAHVVVEALDAQHPATLSIPALRPLREELHFQGAIVSDDLEMKAVADHYRVAEMATMGIHAGVDVFLACHAPDVILELKRSLVRAVEEKLISHEQILACQKRALTWRDAYQKAPVPRTELKRWLGAPEHRAITEQLLTRHAQLV